jgi:hypothetical protein
MLSNVPGLIEDTKRQNFEVSKLETTLIKSDIITITFYAKVCRWLVKLNEYTINCDVEYQKTSGRIAPGAGNCHRYSEGFKIEDNAVFLQQPEYLH